MRVSSTRYRHLTDADIEYVVLNALAENVLVGDLVLDAQYWVRGISADPTLGRPAVRLDLEGWEVGTAARLVLGTGSPVKLARPVGQLDGGGAVPRFDPASGPADRSVPTASLNPGDVVVLYGDDAEVKAAHRNGLIVFQGGGVHQSQPDLFWGVHAVR